MGELFKRELNLERGDKIEILKGSVLGGLVGLVVTWCVLPIMLEITFNTFFAFYFALLFMAAGILLIITNTSHQHTV